MPKVICPNGHRLQIKDANIGQIVRCPGCQASFVATPAPDEGGDYGGGSGEGSYNAGGGKGGGMFSARGLTNLLIGKPMLFIGLILVLFGRGCDAIGVRATSSTLAQYTASQQKWSNEWNTKFRKIDRELKEENTKLNELFKKAKPGDEETMDRQKDIQKRQKKLREERDDLASDQDKDRENKEDNEWKKLREASQASATNHRYYIYFYEIGFIGGTMILMIGLLVIAFTGLGAERWIAYIMIAIITFSIYVVGAAWIESISTSVQSMNERPTIIDSRPGGGMDRPFDKGGFDKFKN